MPNVYFGSFELEAETGILKKHGVRLRLARQPARILAILAQRSGEVVSRDELRAQVWGADTFVDFEHGLNAAINKLRQVLGDSVEKPRYIETLPGHGYRFVATVRLEEATTPISDPAPDPGPAPKAGRNSRDLVLRGALLLLAVALGIHAWMLLRSEPAGARFAPAKFIIPAPEGVAFQPSGARQSLAVSPDGSKLAFTTLGEDGELRLWLRTFTELEPKEMQSARGLNAIFWAPSGDALFFGANRSLRRIPPIPGASWQIISELPRRVPPSGAWLSPDRILLSNRQLTVVVPSGGGRPEVLQQAYLWPQTLPGGKQLLYLVYDSQISRFRLRIGPFGDPRAGQNLLETDSRVIWVPSTETPGASYLLYVRAGSLLAQRFDLHGLRLSGEPVALATNIHVFQPTGSADFSVSENGVLVYQPLMKQSRIAWVDRLGRELQQVGPDGVSTTYVRASPDGRRIAASVNNAEKTANELWVYDTQSKVARVIVPGPGIMDKPSSYAADQSGKSSRTRTNRAWIRNCWRERKTEPSRMYSASSCLPTSRMFCGLPLKAKDEVWERTTRPSRTDRLRMSS